MQEELYPTKEIHKEKVFEEHIHKCLIQDQGYIERICETDYDCRTRSGKAEILNGADKPNQRPMDLQLKNLSGN